MRLDDESIESLEELRDLRLREIAMIKTQLEQAKSDVMERGVYSDSEWFRKATHALRMKGVEHQQLCTTLAKRKRERTKKAVADEAQRFKDAARILLPRELFMQIVDAANFGHEGVTNE